MSVHNIVGELEAAGASQDIDLGASSVVRAGTYHTRSANKSSVADGEISTDSVAVVTGLTGVLFPNGLRSTSATIPAGYGTGAGGAVTQITDATTAVTLNTPCGQITTVALTTAAAAEEVFTLTNSRLAATDVLVTSTTYAGAGVPIVYVTAMAAGSCKINITNVHAANALNAVMVINFAIIKAVAA